MHGANLSALLLHIHPLNPPERGIRTVVQTLEQGGVIIYPTDTLYAFGCDPFNTAAVERICKLKGIKPKEARFSLVCADLSHMSRFAKSVDTATFRLLKAALPGPFTFVLPASREVPKLLKSHRDAVGIRVPDHPICAALVAALGRPLMSASLPTDDCDVECYTDPEEIWSRFSKQVDLVIDGGAGGIEPSTVIDCTGPVPEIIREGAGDAHVLLG